MDSVDSWAIKIAGEVAPDEIDLAPAMARAFLAGGKDRDELFRQQAGAVQGAFGPEFGVALFTAIMLAIQQAGPHLSGFFEVVCRSSESSYHVLGVITTVLAIRGRKKRENKKKALVDDSRIIQAHDRLTEEISKVKGLDEDQADLLTYRILRAMLEDPSGAAEFTNKVEKASP